MEGGFGIGCLEVGRPGTSVLGLTRGCPLPVARPPKELGGRVVVGTWVLRVEVEELRGSLVGPCQGPSG